MVMSAVMVTTNVVFSLARPAEAMGRSETGDVGFLRTRHQFCVANFSCLVFVWVVWVAVLVYHRLRYSGMDDTSGTMFFKLL
jgi:hypothetical protein